MTDPDADRMIAWFAWKRRLRNAVGLVFGAAAVAALLYFIFRAELPDLNWADESTRVLVDLPPSTPPEAPIMPSAPAQEPTPPDEEPEEPPEEPEPPPEEPGPPDEEPEEPPEEPEEPEEPDQPDAGVESADAAVEDIGGPIPIPPGEEENAMARGHRLLRRGDAWKALLAFEEASEQRPRSAEPLYWMGISYLRLGKYVGAQTQFRRALTLDDRHVPSIYGLADALRLNAQTKESVEWYRRYLELSPRGKHRTVAMRAIEAFED